MALDERDSAVLGRSEQGNVGMRRPRALVPVTTDSGEAAAYQPADTDPRRFFQWGGLKLGLVMGDAIALLVGACLGFWVSGYFSTVGLPETAIALVVAVIAGVWSLRRQGLLLARNCAMRVLEITKISRACVALGVVLLVADRVLKLQLRIEVALIACIAVCVVLVAWRSGFRAWLAHARAAGRYLRPTLVVGADAEAGRLIDLLVTHRELGMHVVGLVGGDGDGALRNLRDMWLGDVDATEDIVRRAGASGVIISPIGIETARFNALVRNLQRDGVHVFVATGLAGIEARRLRSLSLAHEPMLFVEPPKFNRMQSVVKRAFDIVVSVLLLVLASPVMAVCALAVKLGDRGPVFFQQVRVGRNGRLFRVMKFRTMSTDAERRVHDLREANERSGPLFKMASDPRVTKVGRLLRDSSLDELPQLFNVLRGEMSLVGPRPALPSEVAQFTPELRSRELVMPGITGLWQVEARDNPSFEAYRRLDLFYVENWSTTLDLMIVLATIEHIAVRLISMVGSRLRRQADEAAADAVAA